MNRAAELLLLIESSGGHLEIADGRLRAVHVLPEFYAAVLEHRDALIALLLERAKPYPANLLISPEKLAAAAARVAAKVAPPPPAPAPGYVYVPRTREQRMDQDWTDNRTFRPPKPVAPIIEDPEIEDDLDNDDTGELPKSKVSSTIACLCGHPRGDHHTAPEPHVADHDFSYYCILSHCSVYSRKDGISAPCDCQYFRVAETDPPKFTKPRVGPYDRCGNPACGHWKRDHCTASKPGKVNRLKPGEMAIRSLQKADGTWYGCKHFSLTDPLCQCTSTSCSHTSDGKEFCSCEKFANPWLVRKTRVPSGKPRNRKPVAASLVVAATLSTSETLPGDAPVKVRKPRKKKATATTGEMFPPEPTTVTQPTGEKC